MISKIVIEELIQQYIEDYNEKYNELESNLDKLINDCDNMGWCIELTKKNNMKPKEYEIYILMKRRTFEDKVYKEA